MTLTIIIPLYNEEEKILLTLNGILHLSFPEFVKSKEIIVVNDGSSDGSAEIVADFISSHAGVKLINHENNQGKGAAIRSGIKAAAGEVIVFQDADMELIPQDILTMLEAMQALDLQFVNGSRYLAGVIRPLFSFRRYMANKIFTALTSLIVNVKITDVACGYKLIKREFIQSLNLKENRFGFETELMIKALRKANIREIAEVPVHYSPRSVSEGKKIRNTDAFRILWVIIKSGLLRY